MGKSLFRTKKNKDLYYDSTDIDATNALYRIIIGKRSNGKTFNYIHKVINEWFENGNPSVYIRRYSEETRPKFLADLMQPHNNLIKLLSKGKYNNTVYKNNAFTLCRVEDGRVVEKADKPILYTLAVNTWLTAKGADRGYVSYIAYDEFMTRDLYLKDEFVDFTNILSSIIRDRPPKAIYMLANTVNKYCPYFLEMGLKDIEEMQQGDIFVYTYNNKELTVAVEYCQDSTNTKSVEKYYAFENKQLDMITSGEWEIANYQRLEREDFCIGKETFKFKFLVDFNDSKVVGEIHHAPDRLLVYFHPLGNSNWEAGLKDIIYTDKPIMSPRHSHSFQKICNMDGIREAQSLVWRCISMGWDYYSDNETGEIIRNFKLFGAQ